MANYNFETLNSIDFEQLVRDLLNSELKSKGSSIRFQSFPAGKDRGIDLLDSESDGSNYNCIVQVKHQPHTPYDLFLSHLYKSTKSHASEIEKIKKLAPKRYIIATSKSLTLVNREEILDKMKPFILSIQDIFDKERLNQLLTVFPEVEIAHPKLWFSSVAVFNKIFHNDVLERSKLLHSDILEKFKLYVPIYSIEKAVKILEKTHFLVITGEPGCGKTTFAEMVLHMLAGLDFTSYWINKSVSEVEKVMSDDDAKQVFYFDDFLGHTRYEIETSKAQEKGLLHFLQNVKERTNKYFILTTRTALINAAASESERFRRSGLFKEHQEILIRSLSDYDKLRMIQNHLDVKQVSLSYACKLSDQQIFEIARHRNFSPRIIEFVTLEENYKTVEAEAYLKYILHQLDNPHEVWLHAYEQQLDKYDRFLLTTLYSFRIAVDEFILEQAFEERLQYETLVNRVERTENTFHNSFRKLLGSYVVFKRFYEGEQLEFVNPSLEDFFNYYLENKPVEMLRIVNSFLFVEQVYSRFRPFGDNYTRINPGDIFRKRLKESKIDTINSIKEVSKPSYLSLYKAILNYMFFREPNDVRITLQYLNEVNWSALEKVNEFHFLSFLQAAAHNESLNKYICNDFEPIILAQFRLCQSIDAMIKAKSLFDDYTQDYSKFILKSSNHSCIKQHIDFFFEDEIYNKSEELRETATDLQGVWDDCHELRSEIQGIYDRMEIKDAVNLKQLNDINWEAICSNNLFEEEMVREDQAQGPIRSEHDD